MKKRLQKHKMMNTAPFWNRLPEWIRVGLILFFMLVAGWLTATKKLLINQNPVPTETPIANPKTIQERMTVGSAPLLVEVRRTAAEQELGLSWRSSMGQNEGMAFVYGTPQKVMYWMKGMQFPLDFIWVREGEVVELSTQVAAPTKELPVPRTLVPMNKVDMVIEVNAGWVESHRILVGDKVAISY